MNKEKKVIEKGYTLFVTSWENDGDHTKTITKTVETKEEAVLLKDMCLTLFSTKSSGGCGIGNLTKGNEEKAKERIISFMQLNPSLYQICQVKNIDDEEEVYERCLEMNWEVMGGSDFYISRVCKSVEVTYSPIDVFVELIEF